MGKRKMSLQDACDLVPDDLPDGAYWAMAHEISGADYGEAWDELESSLTYNPFKKKVKNKDRTLQCPQCSKKFDNVNRVMQHEASMFKIGKHKRILTKNNNQLDIVKF